MLDVQAFPSLWEGTPLTVFEAMAMGRAIVSTDVDGLGEVLVDGRSALIVPPSDSKSLADGISRVLADEPLRNRLSIGAKEGSVEFDIQNTVNDLESLYEELSADAGESRR
jgi:glycosyltransferase involved in cell wall biosynthesis